jgi:GTP-binding protein
VLHITDTSNSWRITKEGTIFMVTGNKIEKFANRTNFDSEEGLQRLRDIMKKMGIMHKLIREGIEPGNKIRIAAIGDFEY